MGILIDFEPIILFDRTLSTAVSKNSACIFA